MIYTNVVDFYTFEGSFIQFVGIYTFEGPAGSVAALPVLSARGRGPDSACGSVSVDANMTFTITEIQLQSLNALGNL